MDTRTRPAGQFAGIDGLFARLLRILFAVVVLAALAMFGSTRTWPLTLSATAMALITVAAALVCGEPKQARIVFRFGVAASIAAASYVFIQTVPLPGGLGADPLWSEVSAILGPHPATISVAPGNTRFSLLWAALPVLAFLAALVLFDTDERAVGLFRFLGWSGGAVAILALMQYWLAPAGIGPFEKLYYRDSVTGPFVNRNTAATYLGLTCLVLLGCATAAARNMTPAMLLQRALATGRSGGGLPPNVLPFAALFAVTLAALFLTRSRAGVASSTIGLVLLSIILLYGPKSATASATRRVRTNVRLRIAGVILAGLAIAAVLGQRSLLRAASKGLEDDRFCMLPRMVDAAVDRAATGSGFGNFEDVFASYRLPECGIDFVWDRAHDSYVEGAIGLGLPFMVAAAALAVALGLVFVKGIRTRVRLRYVPAVGLAALVLTAAHALVDFSLQIPGFAVVLATLLAASATVACGRLGQTRSLRPRAPGREPRKFD